MSQRLHLIVPVLAAAVLVVALLLPVGNGVVIAALLALMAAVVTAVHHAEVVAQPARGMEATDNGGIARRCGRSNTSRTAFAITHPNAAGSTLAVPCTVLPCCLIVMIKRRAFNDRHDINATGRSS